MRIAIVHDYLNQLGGAERVLEYLLEIFPEADLYTLFHDQRLTQNRFAGRVRQTSFLNHPFVRRHHRWFIPLMPLAAANLNLANRYDLIISASAGYAKGIRYHPRTRHISYCYTPLRYAWEAEYLRHLPLPLTPKNFLFRRLALQPLIAYLRRWDYQAAQKPDRLIAISQFIAAKIKKYYRREALVVYPPFNHKKFFFDPQTTHSSRTYYLAAGRLLHYKNFHIIIEAFKQLHQPLKIIGAGPELGRLKKIAAGHPQIEFLSFVKDDKLMRSYYQHAKAFIFAGSEDFGLVMVEAQACGTPVIALAAGGALEIIKEGENGLFFPTATVSNLIAALRRFQTLTFNHEKISASASRFSPDNFRAQLLKYV